MASGGMGTQGPGSTANPGDRSPLSLFPRPPPPLTGPKGQANRRMSEIARKSEFDTKLRQLWVTPTFFSENSVLDQCQWEEIMSGLSRLFSRPPHPPPPL